MQPLAAGAARTAYHDRLRSSHDFAIHVDVLSLDERLVGTARALDGQVNITKGPYIRRTASLSLSDPDGALDFSGASAWSGTSLWVDRLIRVRHVISVPGHGQITAVPFVGPPTKLSRQGAEVQVECADKAALATRGARPHKVSKGMLATTAIRQIMAECTGEFRFRIPTLSRRLSRAYSVGLTDDAAPIVVATQIAQAELGMQLLYSCDGYLMLRHVPTSPAVHMGFVTDQASASADFTKAVNFVQVTGKAISKKKGLFTITTQAQSTAQTLPSNPVSPARISRRDVPRLLPLIITEDGYTTTKQTAARAASELAHNAGVSSELSASVVPMFHLDADDMVTVDTGEGDVHLRLTAASIPLGVAGDMSIGFNRWVSSRALGRPRSRTLRHVVKRKPPKSKKKPGGTKK